MATTGMALAFARPTRRDGVTHREMLERLILAADKKAVARLDPDSPGWEVYFGVTA